MTLLLRPVDMSHRGGYPSDHWSRQGTGRGLPVSGAEDVRAYPRRLLKLPPSTSLFESTQIDSITFSSHPDDMPSTTQARSDRYSIPGPRCVRCSYLVPVTS